MLRKIITLTLLTTLTLTTAFAQRRDFRRERKDLAREEKEEKRRLKSEGLGRPSIDYETNILRVSPFTALDIGVGFGLSYEKIFGKDQMMGLVLPVYMMIGDRNATDPFSNNNGYYNGYADNNNLYFYFNPGLKIYPFGQRKITYAVGPSLLLGYGGGTQWSYNNIYGYQEQKDVTKLRLGMLVNNYVNFQLTKGFNMGVEVGLGVRYIDRETVEGPSYKQTFNNGISLTGQFSLTLGYRF